MAVTQTSSVTWDQAAYEQLAYFALRAATMYDQFVTVKPTNQSMPGASVIFDFATELVPALTALTEASDITPATMGDTQTTVTLAEYGNGVQATALLEGVSYLPVDPIMANLIGYNMADSVDWVAYTEMMNGTNIRYSGGVASRVTVAAGSIIASNDVRFVVAKLRAANAMTFDGTSYAATIHPDVSYDLRGATASSASWRDAMPYTDSGVGRIYNAYIGTYEGIKFMETPRTYGPNPTLPTAVDGTNKGVGSIVDVYATMVFGQQAVAKAYSVQGGWGADPVMVVAPVVDFLRRKAGVGWKHLVGYKVFRQAALYRIESSSSIGTNAT